MTSVLEADARGEPVLVLGGGSNLVVADEGFDGLVVRVASRGVRATSRGRARTARGRGGRAVGRARPAVCGRRVERRRVPIGDPGARRRDADPERRRLRAGGEGDHPRGPRARSPRLRRRGDRRSRRAHFAYRTSAFKGSTPLRRPRCHIRAGGAGGQRPLALRELTRALGVEEGARAPLDVVRRTILALRRAKGMVLDPNDPDSVSAGSFFVNPSSILARFAALAERLRARGIDSATLPRFPGDDGRTKASAAWLIERAGFREGVGGGAGRDLDENTRSRS